MSQSIHQLLGNTFVDKAGKTYDASRLAGKHLLVYYSAHWCPPCRRFTPMLAKFYQEHHAAKNFEVVFVSSDKDEAQFNEYLSEMPWIALPYADRERKNSLSKFNKVSGIPCLCVFDTEGNRITTSGVEAVYKDTNGANFPWKPKTFRQILTESGNSIVDHNGHKTSFDTLLQQNDYIGFYFSAHWCPPCRGFTPKFVQTYKKIKAAGHKFEVVFVTSDRSAQEFEGYFKEMPWKAIDFEADALRDELSTHFNVEGIPHAVLLDTKTLKVVNDDLRSDIAADPEGTKFPYPPQPLKDLAAKISMINDHTLVMVMDAAGKSAIEKLAEEYTKRFDETGVEEQPCFFLYGDDDALVAQIREFLGFDSNAKLVVANLPEGGLAYSSSDVSEANIKKVVDDLLVGKLDLKPIKR